VSRPKIGLQKKGENGEEMQTIVLIIAVLFFFHGYNIRFL
jgi:hypothetical protein